MNKQSEKITETYLRKRVLALGGQAVKIPGGFDAGMPDRIVLLPRGTCFFVELKSEGRKPSLIQLNKHKQLRALGFEVFVADTREAVDEILTKYELMR